MSKELIRSNEEIIDWIDSNCVNCKSTECVSCYHGNFKAVMYQKNDLEVKNAELIYKISNSIPKSALLAWAKSEEGKLCPAKLSYCNCDGCTIVTDSLKTFVEEWSVGNE